jgi:hypothetical protein
MRLPAASAARRRRPRSVEAEEGAAATRDPFAVPGPAVDARAPTRYSRTSPATRPAGR